MSSSYENYLNNNIYPSRRGKESNRYSVMPIKQTLHKSYQLPSTSGRTTPSSSLASLPLLSSSPSVSPSVSETMLPSLTESNQDNSSTYLNYLKKAYPFNTATLKSSYTDITNPDYYSLHSNDYYTYKRQSNDYYTKSQEEAKAIRLKKYFESKKNNNVFLNVGYLDFIQGKKKVGEVNPFNPHQQFLGESTLEHNTILNPVRNYKHNKYIAKPFQRAGENIFGY